MSQSFPNQFLTTPMSQRGSDPFHSIMRVGILTSTQATDTPYSQAHRYVSKKAVKALLSRTHRAIAGRKDVIQERPIAVIAAISTSSTLVSKVSTMGATTAALGSITERNFKKAALRNVTVRRNLPPAEANPNLDLAYPEALRMTVIPKHPGMLAACAEARQRAKSANV